MPKGKAFKGFSDTQMKRIAQKLGYTGKIGQFKDFLKSNPALAAKYNALENIARMKFAEGGAVDPNKKEDEQQVATAQPIPDTTSAQPTNTTTPATTTPASGVTVSTLPTPGTQQGAPATQQPQPQQMQMQAQAQQEAQQAIQPDQVAPMNEQILQQAQDQYEQQMQEAQQAPAPTDVTAVPPQGTFNQYLEQQNQFMQNYLTNAPAEVQALPQRMQDINGQLQQKYGAQAKTLNDMYESKYGERARSITSKEEADALSAEIQADTELQNMQTSLQTMMENDPLTQQGRQLQTQYSTYMQRGVDEFASNNPAPSMADVAVGRMENPQLPAGGQMQPAMTNVDQSQFIGEGVGQITTPVSGATTGAVGTATADMPPEFATSTVDAATAETGVRTETDALKAAQGEVSQQAQVTAAEMNPTNTAVGTVPAAQIAEATKVDKPASRTLQSGELVDAAANAQKGAAFAEEIQSATANPSAAATVKGQLNDLMADFEDGKVPSWAAGAMRSASAGLAARGLSMSSMAGQAIVQAAMESALPIAQADANTQAQFEAQNLSNRQARAMLAAEQRATFMGQEFDQTFQARVANAAKISDIANMNFNAEQQIALENARIANSVDLANLDSQKAMALAEAAQIANLETTNLNNRQQAAVQNAKSFLDMDMANLSNEQQTAIFKSQQNIQALLSDQAAENAARQFNATSENQTNQFMANLTSQINQYNATQTNAMAQYNESNAIDVQKFNGQMQEARDQFNAQNQLVVSQSNAQWRRDIATADTAAINASNEFNAKAVLDISNQAYDNLWQTYSDVMEYAWKSGENERDRINDLMRQQLANDGAIDIAKLQANASDNQALGGFFSRALFGSGGLFGI